jgi:hypothetical protein
MTNKKKLVIGIMTMTVALALVTGCSSEKPAAEKPADKALQQQGGDMKGHDMSNMGNMNMPKEDPMPFLKDVDKDLQDIVKEFKAGQTMDAQKTAGMLTSTAEKIMPHMMNAPLKDNMRKAATDIKDSVGKADPAAIEGKVKAMQDIMKQVTTDVQSMKH